jgi:hypothetical protein
MFFLLPFSQKSKIGNPPYVKKNQAKMLKRGGSFGNGVAKKRVKTFRRSFQSVLVDTRLAETVLAPFCTTRDLAALVTCRGVLAAMTRVLTTRKVWDLDDMEHLSRERLSLVHNLRACRPSTANFLNGFTSLVYLDLNIKLEHPLPVFPASLKHLKLGFHSNKPLQKNMFPSGLTHLVFGWEFDQPLEAGVLPSGLQHLTLGNMFDQPLETGVLPSGLQHLTLGNMFNQPLKTGVLPVGLRSLKFIGNFNIFECVVPASLQELQCSLYTNVHPIPAGCKIHVVPCMHH